MKTEVTSIDIVHEPGPAVKASFEVSKPESGYSTRFELSDFKNSLKSLASAGIAIEGPSQEFERSQPLFDRAGQPVLNRIVRVRQADDGKMRAV